MQRSAITIVLCLVAATALAEGEIVPAEPAETLLVDQQEAAAVQPPPTPAEPELGSAEPAVTGEVARATFTTGIIDREPVDAIDRLTTDHDQVFFFSELRGLGGRGVTHRWELAGEVMAEVPFEVGGDTWRVYSSKKLIEGWTGEWSVSVVDSQGRVLTRHSFEYEPASPPSPASPE